MKGGEKMAAMEKMTVGSLFSLEHTIAARLFDGIVYPWEALSGIKDFILRLGATLGDEFERRGEDIWIAKSAKVAPTASINGPCIIDENAEIRHCAYIRGSAIIGKNAVVGNSTEVKNAVLFDGAQAPHFNYVGDSVLGYRAHMGAGAVTSNIKSDKTNVTIRFGTARVETGLRKFGAMLGDFVEVGCNSVLCPGAVVGQNTTVYPLSQVRGFVDAESIFKSPGDIVKKRTREA
jgi:NDP-sugar pyrophosphorylase family protein